MSSGPEPAMDLEDLLNPEEQRQFRRLCIATSIEELEEQAAVVQMHVEQIKDMAEPATDVDTAVLIGQALGRLLGSGIAFDDDQRAQIRGAIEYFVMAEDATSDLLDVLGFDDDVRVVNAMLGRIGHPEFIIEFPA